MSDWISKLGLEAHPEGGFFRRIYTATRAADGRPLATSIYYLLNRAQPRGRLHANRSDILHFLLDGGPADYLVVEADGGLRRARLDAESRFLLVAANEWKATQLAASADRALIAEVVVPGFEWHDHRYVAPEEVRGRCPQHFELLSPFLEPCTG